MNREVSTGLAIGGGIVALAVAATAARQLGFIDQDTVLRLVIGINGLVLAWYGNRMPKRSSRVPGYGRPSASAAGRWC